MAKTQPKGLFGGWLYSTMKMWGVSMTELAKEIGLSRLTIARHICEKCCPRPYDLQLYSTFFNKDYETLRYYIGIDYGTDDQKGSYRPSIQSECIFGDWLYRMMLVRCVGVEELSRELALDPKTIRNHLRGLTKPTIWSIKRYCEFFKIENWCSIYELTLKESVSQYIRS